MKRKAQYPYFGNRRRNAGGHVPSLSGLVSLAGAARVEHDETVKSLIKAVHYTQDAAIAQATAEYLGALALEQVLNPDPFAPPLEKEEAMGNIVVGQVRNSPCHFGLRLNEMCQHVLVMGRSGAGKTTLIRKILKQLIIQTHPPSAGIMVFDIKRDYVALPTFSSNVWLFKLPGPDFRWNPLEPPIADCERWAAILAGVFANAAGFFGGMSTENLIYMYLLELYRKYDTANGMYPCLLDLRDHLQWLEKYKKINSRSEEYRWFVRIKNRVESLCNALGETVNCSKGYRLDALLGHHMVFDIAELKTDAQTFFTETFLTQVVWHRIEKRERGGTLRNLAVFDEAKRLMPKYREEAQQAISNMSNILAMAREFGVGFIVGECDPALLANSIKSMCYSRFCFSQTTGRDIAESALALGLDRDQAAEIQSLEVGEAIVRLSGRIKRPFVLQVEP